MKKMSLSNGKVSSDMSPPSLIMLELCSSEVIIGCCLHLCFLLSVNVLFKFILDKSNQISGDSFKFGNFRDHVVFLRTKQEKWEIPAAASAKNRDT